MFFADFEKQDEELRLMNKEMAELTAKSPVEFKTPPPCFDEMQGSFLRYSSRKALLVTFPVLEKYLNPMQVMQGGFIAAAFDNVFGPLSFLAAQRATTTLDMSQTYLRAARVGELIFCEAEVIARSPRILFMQASLFNAKKKLVASSQTQVLVL